MSVYKPKGSEFYSYDFFVNKQRFWGPTGCKNKRDAERFEEQLKVEAKAKARAAKQAATRGLGAPITVEQALIRYFEEKGRFLKRSDKVEWSLAYLNAHLGPNTLIKDIGNNEVAALVAKRRQEKVENAATFTQTKIKRRIKPRKPKKTVSASTVNRSVTEPLRKVLNRARDVWEQEVKKIDWAQHLLKEPQERIRCLSEDEETRLFSALDPKHHDVITFAARMGLRLSEVVGLPWDRIDFSAGTILVFGKNDKLAPVPIPEDIRALLLRQRGRHPKNVFAWETRPTKRSPQTEWRPYTQWGLDTLLGRAVERAGIVDFHFHDLRHTAATRLLRQSGNLKWCRNCCGTLTSRPRHATRTSLTRICGGRWIR
jgi:integrase